MKGAETMAQTMTEQDTAQATGRKRVYLFEEGNASMRDLLGGKRAGVAEMTRAGLPVPPGFTIQTEACREYMRAGRNSQAVEQATLTSLHRLEELQKQTLGSGDNPLLVSVRSGAAISMPGMMDTILNVGLNDRSVEALANRSGNPRFAYDSYRRLIQMFGEIVMEVPKKTFDTIFDGKTKKLKAKEDTDLDADALRSIAEEYKTAIKKATKHLFPQDPLQQLIMARDAVFRSWNNDR